MGLDLGGIGALKDALMITNHNLELVLAELKETNGQRLELVANELQRVNATLETMLASGVQVPASSV